MSASTGLKSSGNKQAKQPVNGFGEMAYQIVDASLRGYANVSVSSSNSVQKAVGEVNNTRHLFSSIFARNINSCFVGSLIKSRWHESMAGKQSCHPPLAHNSIAKNRCVLSNDMPMSTQSSASSIYSLRSLSSLTALTLSTVSILAFSAPLSDHQNVVRMHDPIILSTKMSFMKLYILSNWFAYLLAMRYKSSFHLYWHLPHQTTIFDRLKEIAMKAVTPEEVVVFILL
jgi:hypothetical protein